MDANDTADADGINDRAIVLRGTIQRVNAALNGLVYRSDLNFNTDPASPRREQLIVHVSDLGYTDQDTVALVPTDPRAMTARATLPITVQAVNDPPVLTLPSPQPLTGFEDTDLAVAGISVFDVDAAEGTGQLRLTASVVNGTLAVTGAGSIDIQGNGTASLILTGTQGEITATLASLIYRGKPEFSGADTLVLVVNDQGNSPPPGVDVRGTVFLTLQPLNDRPTLVLPNTFYEVYEDSNLPLPGIVVGDADDAEFSPVTLRVTFTALHGTISVNTNVTGGVGLGGVANNGTSSVSLTGTPAAINATLANADGHRVSRL